ncbi:MAG: hypothetical protein ACRDZ2_04535 [Ilumatobacteraceae bacterium]
MVAALAIVGVAAFFLTRSEESSSAPDDTEATVERTEPDDTTEPATDPPDQTDGPEPTGAGSIPPAGDEPDGLGDDVALDELAQDCFVGDMGACDDLFFDADEDSVYEQYGDTCAGRQPADTGEYCVQAFPG